MCGEKYYQWTCPLCGTKVQDWQEGLDHIVKEHIKEYYDTYHKTAKELKAEEFQKSL